MSTFSPARTRFSFQQIQSCNSILRFVGAKRTQNIHIRSNDREVLTTYLGLYFEEQYCLHIPNQADSYLNKYQCHYFRMRIRWCAKPPQWQNWKERVEEGNRDEYDFSEWIRIKHRCKYEFAFSCWKIEANFSGTKLRFWLRTRALLEQTRTVMARERCLCSNESNVYGVLKTTKPNLKTNWLSCVRLSRTLNNRRRILLTGNLNNI